MNTEEKIAKLFVQMTKNHHGSVEYAAYRTCQIIRDEAEANWGPEAGNKAFIATGDFLASMIGFNIVTLQNK